MSNTVHDLIEKTFLQKSGFKSLKDKPLPQKIEFKYHKLVVHFSFQFSHKYSFENSCNTLNNSWEKLHKPIYFRYVFGWCKSMFSCHNYASHILFLFLEAHIDVVGDTTHEIFSSWIPSLSSISIHKGHWLASTHVSDTYIALYFGLDHHLLQKYHH